MKKQKAKVSQATLDVRKRRQELRRTKYNIISEQPDRRNPKKDKSARRVRDKDLIKARIDHCYKPRQGSSSKYTPDPFTTKKKKAVA